jgi:hypothetical protein
MGIVSIVINLITLIAVSLVFYITFLAFNKRQARDETWLQTFKRLWSSDKEVNQALKGPTYGDLGSFVGQDWGIVPSIPIKEADSQDDLLEFIAQGSPNYVGTGGPTS